MPVGMRFADSASKHGVAESDVLWAIGFAVEVDLDYLAPRDADHGPADRYIGSTSAGVLIEVLVERALDGDFVVFHAQPIRGQRRRGPARGRRKP